MKREFLLGLFLATPTPLWAQESLEDLLANPGDFVREVPALPHMSVTNGRDNPSAIPLYVPALSILHGQYGRELDGTLSAVDRFADRYVTDFVLASAMVTGIRQVFSDMEANRIAQMRAFCARSFSNTSSWKAAMIAFDADSVSAQVAAFDKLRDIAGPEVWERIVLEAYARPDSLP